MGTQPEEPPGQDEVVAGYDVAVALRDLTDDGQGPGRQTVDGYDDADGARSAWGRHVRDRGSPSGARGAAAVQIATEALAGQIAVAAQHIASSIEQRPIASPAPGRFNLDSIEVSFGVTLTGGVQWLFTAQAESSAQVTITLTRQPSADGPSDDHAPGRPVT